MKVTDLPQAFYRWESSVKEFRRGRPDVSQMSSNVSIPETEEQECASYTHEKDQEYVMEMKCMQSRERAKVVSKELGSHVE